MQATPRRIALILIWTAVGTLALLAAWQIHRRLDETYPLVVFERSRGVQQLVSLRLYAAREPFGTLLPPGDAQVAIREAFLQDVLARSLPIRLRFEKGRYEARLDRARLDFQDGLASIVLQGNGVMAGTNASPLEADLRLQSHIDVVELRADTGTLRASLAITAVRVLRAGRGPVQRFLNPVARYFSGLKAEDWNRERPILEIPIRLEREITLPRVEGEVSLRSRALPFAARVSAVTVLGDRLALSLALEPETGEVGRITPGEIWVAPDSTEQARIAGEARRIYERGEGIAARERLLARVRALAARDSLWRGIEASNRDVVAVFPRSLLQKLCNRLADTYLRSAQIDFDPELRKRLQERVTTRVLGQSVGAGRLVGELRLLRLRGVVQVLGDPTVQLRPPDAVEFTTPVKVEHGRGRVDIDMRWDPALLVAAVCRGFAFQETLAAEVIPFSHVLKTSIRFRPAGSSIVGEPVVRRDRVHVPWMLTDASIAKVREALVEQDRLLRCGLVMNSDSVLAKVRRLVRNDVRIGLPADLFKPFSLPVSLQGEYDAGDFHVHARVRDPEVVVRADYLVVGFRAELTVRPHDAALAPAPRAQPREPSWDSRTRGYRPRIFARSSLSKWRATS